MITKLPYTVNKSLISKALNNDFGDEKKLTINRPTGNFFYDPWEIKQEYKKTVWDDILSTLPVKIGEARIIRLTGGESYISHADIDDRYHLNLSGVKCFLIDLENTVMYPTVSDGIWYKMDTGLRHSAANFGNRIRYQLVIRELLNRFDLKDPISVKLISLIDDPDEVRFIFDDNISPWLNRANKLNFINNFSVNGTVVSFECEKNELTSLEQILPEEIKLEI